MLGLPILAAEEGATVVHDDWASWIVLFAPLAVAFLVACVPTIRKRGGLAATLSIGAIALGLVITLQRYFLPALAEHGGETTWECIRSWISIPVGDTPLEITFGARIDALAITMMLVVTGVGLAIHVYSLGYMRGDPSKGRFFGKLSLFVFSMLGIVVSPNFIQTFVFWELVGVSSYLLIGYYWEKDSAGEAAKKAFMTNRVGDFGFLLGILVLWSAAGALPLAVNPHGHTFDFVQLKEIVTTAPKHYDVSTFGAMAAIGGALVFCGAMGKSAQFPLHVWLPDAMEGPTPVSALMHAATMVAAGVYMIIRCFFLFEGTTWAPTLIAWLGGITALIAATMAVTQRDIKKILAYSTLSQLGYMTLALGAGAYTGAMFHLTTHAFFKALLFLGAGSVIHACHTQDIFEMGGLRRFMPSTYRTFLIGTLALCGIFPFAGFWSKDEILGALFHAETLPGHYALWALGTFVAGLTAFYMGRAFIVTFLGTYRGPAHAAADAHGGSGGHGGGGGDEVDTHGSPHESPRVMTIPLWILAFFSVTAGFVGIPGASNRFERFLEAWSMEEGVFHLPIAVISTVVALAGIALAWRVYRRAAPGTDPLPERLGALWRLWNELWYVDAFYLWLVKRVQQGIAWLSWRFERLVIIGGMVNGTSQGARLLGDRLRRVQDGRLTHYVTWLLLGTVAVAAVVLFGEPLNVLLAILLLPAAAVVAMFLVPGDKPKAIRTIAFVATLATLGLAVWLTATFQDAPSTGDAAEAGANGHVYKHVMSVPWVPALGLQLKLGVDGMGVAMVLLTALTIFTGVMVSFSIRDRVKEYYINLLALVTGVFGVFTALDLFFYYFFYELAVIPMFLLIGCWGSTTRTQSRDYASMKLVLMLTTGAVFALVGLLALYVGGQRTFDMVAIERFANAPGGGFAKDFQLIWFPVVFLGFAVLVPMWPLHSWSPGGHAAAPAAVSMLHAGVLMKLGAYGILRVAVTYMPAAAATYLPWVGALCCMNILYGGLVAMAQRDMKFVVGYSSSSHMGYVLLGIAAANVIGLEGAVFLMFAHGVMTALAFSLIGFYYDQTHTRMLDDLGGLMKRMPFLGTCFVIMTMASAGLPGFANFVAELLVIVGAWANGMKVPAILAVWGIVVTGVYLLRTVKDGFLGKLNPRWEGLVDARTPLQRLPYLVLIAVLLVFGFYPQPLLSVIRQGVEPIAGFVSRARATPVAAAPTPPSPRAEAR